MPTESSSKEPPDSNNQLLYGKADPKPYSGLQQSLEHGRGRIHAGFLCTLDEHGHVPTFRIRLYIVPAVPSKPLYHSVTHLIPTLSLASIKSCIPTLRLPAANPKRTFSQPLYKPVYQPLTLTKRKLNSVNVYIYIYMCTYTLVFICVCLLVHTRHTYKYLRMYI